jgi:hypothetical protein
VRHWRDDKHIQLCLTLGFLGCKDMNWVLLAHERTQWQALGHMNILGV